MRSDKKLTTDSIHSRAGMAMLGMLPLSRFLYFDIFDFQGNSIIENKGTWTSLAVKIGMNAVAPILLSYAAAAVYNRYSPPETADVLPTHDTPSVQRYVKPGELNDNQLARYRVVRSFGAVGFSLLLSLIPWIVQNSSSNPNQNTVTQLEKIFSLAPIAVLPILAMSNDLTDLAFHKEQNVDITPAAFFASATANAKFGPFIIVKMIELFNPKLLQGLGEVISPNMFYALTAVVPMALAMTTLMPAAKITNALGTSGKLAATVYATNYASEWVFGNLAGYLRGKDDMKAAEVVSSLMLSTSAQIGLIAASTAVAWVGYTAVTKMNACCNAYNAEQARKEALANDPYDIFGGDDDSKRQSLLTGSRYT
ncbi:MAG: hypothetical protein P1U63_11690 [Coxiellaceae bacterium]|nr:hypothetical protein [Coxiellaceae bacterium]